ncbi:MAG TPA: hypothetical protein VJ922_07970 [Actinomycetota bacterium]|nr:hypothetical protein [Actinomycetota bacterium]
MEQPLGERFARAVAVKDFTKAVALFHPRIDFRGMTPSQIWEAADPETVARNILPQWYEEHDSIDGLLELENGSVGDRRRVRYLYAVHNTDGEFLMEQQAYYEVHDGAITWMRVLCSGWRPRDATPED